MSNTVEFFQSQQNDLAIAAASVCVFVDGALCPQLEVLEIVRAPWPDFSFARLTYNPIGCDDELSKTIEQLETEFSHGSQIVIKQFFNPTEPESAAQSLPIFTGRIESTQSGITNDGQMLQITALDYSASLKRLTVYGRRVADLAGEIVFLPGADTIFNEDSKPNGCANLIPGTSGQYRPFSGDESATVPFTYAEAIYYLLCEYTPVAELQLPTLEQLQSLTDNQIAADLDVTGLNLLDALGNCCQRCGLEFKFAACSYETAPAQAIVFYKPAQGRTVELSLQQPGSRISLSKTNIARFNKKRNYQPVTHRYIGQGEYKIFEATFDLVKAWDSTLENANLDAFSPSTNSQFHQVKDVYRKWSLNEAGFYTGPPYQQGDAFDFSKVFGSSFYIHRRRRFFPTLTVDKQGQSLGYFLEVSYDSGQSWRQYLQAFNILLNECGLWLSSDRLDFETWVAAITATLRFRITASVISDEKLTRQTTTGPIGSSVPVIDHLLQLPRQFKYRKVTSRSIFAESAYSSYTADEVDDSAALAEFVRKWAGSKSEVIETVDLQTPYLALYFQTGDRITLSPPNRKLPFDTADPRNTNHIEKVRLDFKSQQTELRIIKRTLSV